MKVRVALTGRPLQQAGYISDSCSLVRTTYDLVLSAEFFTLI